MFKKDDYVMYGSAGVCQIQKVDYADFLKDEKKKYYFLKPLYSICDRICVPVDSKAKMRRVLTKQEANALIDRMAGMEAEWAGDDNTREEAYKEAIRSFDSDALARMAKSLYQKTEERKSEGKKPLQMDEKYMAMAEEYLFGELAVALGMPIEKVEAYIARKMRGGEG